MMCIRPLETFTESAFRKDTEYGGLLYSFYSPTKSIYKGNMTYSHEHQLQMAVAAGGGGHSSYRHLAVLA